MWNFDMSQAPRDGTILWLADPDCGAFIMRYNPQGENEFFAPGDVGIWEAMDKSFTWRDTLSEGPTRWKIATCPNGSIGWDEIWH